MGSFKTQLLSPEGWRQRLDDGVPKREVSFKTIEIGHDRFLVTVSACRKGWRDVRITDTGSGAFAQLAVCQRQRGLAAVSAFQTFIGD